MELRISQSWLTWAVISGLVGLVGKELVLELIFGSAADWLKSNLWVLGDFLAWRWSSLALGFILLIGVWVLGLVVDHKRAALAGAGQATTTTVAPSTEQHEMAPESYELLREHGYTEDEIAQIVRTIEGYDDRNTDLAELPHARSDALGEPMYQERVAAPRDEPDIYLAEHAIHQDKLHLRLNRITGEFPKQLTCVVSDPQGVNSTLPFLEKAGLSLTGPNTAWYPQDFSGAPPLRRGTYQVRWIDAGYQWVQSFKRGRVIATDSFTIE